MKKIFINLFICAITLLGMTSCNDYFNDGGLVSTEPLKINSLEFIKSRPDLFDTTLLIIQKSGLEEVIKSENITFFVPQKSAIASVMKKVNDFVDQKRDSLGYKSDTVTLDDVPNEVWKNFLSRYIFKGQHLRDDVTKGKVYLTDRGKKYITGGEDVTSYDGYVMKLFCDWTSWENVEEVGPHYIYICDSNGTNVSDPDRANFQYAMVISSNIRTTSGVIHVLGRGHEFGFNNSDKFIPAK